MGEETIFHSREGRITRYSLMVKERRRITFEPIGREERVILERVVPTDKLEE